MTPEQKQKIEAAARNHGGYSTREGWVEVSTPQSCEIFIAGATYGISLVNEPVGDDVRDAHKYGLTICPLTNQAPQALLYKSIAITAFLAGRAGMVPATAVEHAVRSDRERIIKALIDEERKEYIAVDMIYNEALFRGHYESIITPTNQGEKE